ncbi:Uncharacterised protein [Serratia liquefaciens]|nr:Uncharacterised protein [Serratia liquefaciens]
MKSCAWLATPNRTLSTAQVIELAAQPSLGSGDRFQTHTCCCMIKGPACGVGAVGNAHLVVQLQELALILGRQVINPVSVLFKHGMPR